MSGNGDGQGENRVSVFIMNKKYDVPETMTIMQALEYAGYRYIRGCGCRGGYCGACATFYRLAGDVKLRTALACQKVVEEGMYLVQLPFFPSNKKLYDLEELSAAPDQVLKVYPELYRCLGCNTCTKSCYIEIPTLEYVTALVKGDYEKAAELSFECVMCGLCAARCPAELTQFQAAMLGQRIYGKYVVPRDEHLAERVGDILAGSFEEGIRQLMRTDTAELKKMYAAREIEP
ncbi:MAG: 4Fe-4S dicluster domain-containing protein [Chloroflexota bacterium]